MPVACLRCGAGGCLMLCTTREQLFGRIDLPAHCGRRWLRALFCISRSSSFRSSMLAYSSSITRSSRRTVPLISQPPAHLLQQKQSSCFSVVGLRSIDVRNDTVFGFKMDKEAFDPLRKLVGPVVGREVWDSLAVRPGLVDVDTCVCQSALFLILGK
jgi:hypothetical protein